MMIQYTFCIKIFVLLLRYRGFVFSFFPPSLNFSLSDDSNNRLCFNISFSAVIEIAEMFAGRRLTFLVTTTITGRICSGYLNYFYYSWLKLKNHGFEAFFMNKILLKYQSEVCKTKINYHKAAKNKKNSLFHL